METNEIKRKILVVEDNIILLNMMKVFLERAGYTVRVSKSGKEAIEAINEESFDLMIVDLMLSYLNGFEVIDYIRNSPVNANSKVMIISDYSDEHAVKNGFEVGADDFLKKPVSPQELITRVEHHLNAVHH